MSWIKLPIIGAVLGAVLMVSVLSARPETELEKFFSAELGDNDVAYTFLSFSGVVVRTALGTIVFDPADLLVDNDIPILAKHKIDALLYTHGHGDHFNAAMAQRIVSETGVTIVAEPAVAGALKKTGRIPEDKILVTVAGRAIKAGEATVQSVVGKHVGPIALFHVQLGPLSIFHGGDSAYVQVANCPSQIAFLPTGRPSPTASPADALKMALDVKPRVVVLVHGADEQHAEFKKLAADKLPGVVVEIAEPFKTKVVRIR